MANTDDEDSDHFPGESPNLDYEEFDFNGLGIEPFENVILSNTERQQLRALAEPGGPLYRIMSGLLSYKVVVERGFSRVNLGAPNAMIILAALQSEIKAIEWQYRMWQRQLTFIEPETPNEDQPND